MLHIRALPKKMMPILVRMRNRMYSNFSRLIKKPLSISIVTLLFGKVDENGKRNVYSEGRKIGGSVEKKLMYSK